jgi:hypothetical protein
LFSTRWPVPLRSASSWRSHPAGGQSWLLKVWTGQRGRCATGCWDAGSRLEAGCCSKWNTRMRPRTRHRVASAIGERLLGKFTRSHPSRSCSDLLRDSRARPICLNLVDYDTVPPVWRLVAAFGLVRAMTKSRLVPSGHEPIPRTGHFGTVSEPKPSHTVHDRRG